MIHIDIGNIYFDNFSTNENFHNFILAQQDTSKKLLNVKLSFGKHFQQYIRKYLAGIKAQDDEKYDMLSNKYIYSIDTMIFYR